MIHPEVFARWVQAFAQRLRSELGEEALAVYYAELSDALDTEAFEVAARRVFAEHTYNTWPAPKAFVRAAPRLRPRPDPTALGEQRATARLLASHDAIPRAPEDVHSAFHAAWTAALAGCDPASVRRERLAGGDPDGARWATDPTPPAVPQDPTRLRRFVFGAHR